MKVDEGRRRADLSPGEGCEQDRPAAAQATRAGDAWNRAATAMLMDYGSLRPEQRNILRFLFLDPRARAAQYDWESVARFVLGAFRIDAARAGAAG